MPTIKLTRTVSSSPADLWQVLADFDHWPDVFSEISRCKVLRGTAPDIELQCADSLGRVWHEICEAWQPRQRLRMSVRADDNHPYRKLARTWEIAQSGDSTELTLACEYAHRMPILGKWLERFFAANNLNTICESAIDNVVQRAREQKWAYKETVQTILNNKGSDIVAAHPAYSVARLCTMMKKHRIGTILVKDDNDKLVGLVSERDVVFRIAAEGKAVLDLQAEDIMTRKLIVCEPEHDLFFVMACMTDNKVRHLPVLKDGVLLGIVSIGDIVKQRMHTLEAESETLREYIAAREWRYHNHQGLAAGDATTLTTVD